MTEAPRWQIRPATVADAAPLAELARRVFVETFAAENDPEDLALYLAQAYGEPQQRAELEDTAVRTFLCEADGELVAYAQLRQGRSPACVTGERPLELWRLYVDARWHGRGVARALMEVCLHTAASLESDVLWLGVWERNARAVAFYRKYGFEHVGAHDFMLGNDLQTDWVMLRPLPPP